MTTPQNAAQMTAALTASLEKAKMTTEAKPTPKLKKRPSHRALEAAMYALLAARDSRLAAVDVKRQEEQAANIAARVMLALMKLEQTPDNVQAARVEVVRACFLTGIPLPGQVG